MMENQAAQANGTVSIANPGHRPSDLMVRYETASPGEQPAATEPVQGQASETVQGTDQSTGSEASATGLDATSPEYRHWQSVSDRAIAKARNEIKAEVDALKQQLASIQGKVVQTEIQKRPEAEQQLNESMILDFSRAKPFQSSNDDELAPYGENLTARIRHEIQQAVDLITQRGLQQQAQFQAQEREQKLVAFAQNLPPEQQLEYVQLVNQLGPVAKNDPDAFLELAKYKFQPRAAEPTPTPTSDPTKLARQVTNASTRPTTNGGASPIAAGGNMRDKILAAVRSHGVGA